jgi:hypothetical protein
MNDKYKADLTNAKNAILAEANAMPGGRDCIAKMRAEGITEYGLLLFLVNRLYTKKRLEEIIDALLMGCYDNRCQTKSGSARILAEMLVEDLKVC